MPPLNALDTWSVRSQSSERRPKSKCFIIGEGAITEYKYLCALSTRLAKQGIPRLIELKPIQRTGLERDHSAPTKLLEQAKLIRSDKDGTHDFECDVDQIVVIFDADIFRNDQNGLNQMISSFNGIATVAITNPSFELFLLLHKKNAYQEIVLPNARQMFKNELFEGRRRFVDKLVSETFGINPKKSRVGRLSEMFEVAVKEERNLNQSLELAADQLTSNVGLVLNGIIYDNRT